MLGARTDPIGGGVAGSTGLFSPLQLLDPMVYLDAPAPVKAIGVFLLVAILGLGLRWRYGRFVDRSITASMDRPLSSLGYGLAAHGVIAFGGAYLATQLGGTGLGPVGGTLGLAAGSLLFLLAAALGFTVVGTTIAAMGLDGLEAYGPLVGAAIAGIAAGLDPLVGGVVWFAVVSMGIGGPARRWLHADALDDH